MPPPFNPTLSDSALPCYFFMAIITTQSTVFVRLIFFIYHPVTTKSPMALYGETSKETLA